MFTRVSFFFLSGTVSYLLTYSNWEFFLIRNVFSYIMTSSNGNITGPLWRRALMLSLICAWTNGWASTRDTGDLQRHCTHYDVTVMISWDSVISGIYHNHFIVNEAILRDMNKWITEVYEHIIKIWYKVHQIPITKWFSRLVVPFALPNPLKPGAKSRMKM